MMKYFFHRWDSFWTREVPPHALAITRISLGIFLLIYAATYAPHVAMVASENGILLPYFGVFSPPTPPTAYALYALTILSIIGLLAGYRVRLSLLLLIALALYWWEMTLHLFPSSYNRLLLLTLLVMLLGGSDRTFSIRMLQEHGSLFAWSPISVLPQRLLAVQMSATYLGVGLQKLWLPMWQEGEMLTYAFVGRWGTPLGRALLRLNLPLEVYDKMLVMIKLLELTLPFGLWIRKIQWWFFVGGALFHIGIALLMSIWWFVFLIPMYVLFLPPEGVLAFCEHRFPEKVRRVDP